jgi:hypothetical protein
MTRAAGVPADWSTAPESELRGISGVCLDIDDTLSTHGQLTAEAYSALWRLRAAGLKVVPITGRPAGWCDLIARFWPVDAVVGENGGFSFYMDVAEGGRRVLRRLDTPGIDPDRAVKRTRLAERIRARFPHARWASDQSYREHDLAIDVCEDVPAWPRADVDALLALCAAEGAHAKLSSIHVNAWYGEFDKRKGFEALRETRFAGLPRERWIYIGDSPNDEPMFRHFAHGSVGVANVRAYLDRLAHPPRWITASESGAGFVEMTDRILTSRR